MALAVTTVATALNPVVGDIELSPTGGFFMRTTLADRVHQRLMARLRMFKGEWFLNVDAGMPYFQHILRKVSDTRSLRAIFTQAILGVGGVKELVDLGLDLEPRTRRLTVTFRALLADGTVYDSTNYSPFVIVAGKAELG